MKGRIYISSAFTNLPAKCKPFGGFVDNDPHFWSQPPTWGICRTDFRRNLDPGDFIFFVLPKNAKDAIGSDLPQMIYGYIKIARHINHMTAYNQYPNKRMKNAIPNGNIIVNQNGLYNPYDLGIHKDHFNEIKEHYIVGDESESKFLKPFEIKRLAPQFIVVLNSIFDTQESDIFKVICRKGRVLDEGQIEILLDWLK